MLHAIHADAEYKFVHSLQKRTVKTVNGREDIFKLRVAEVRDYLRLWSCHRTCQPESIHSPLQV
jgi:hypothetical protein